MENYFSPLQLHSREKERYRDPKNGATLLGIHTFDLASVAQGDGNAILLTTVLPCCSCTLHWKMEMHGWFHAICHKGTHLPLEHTIPPSSVCQPWILRLGLWWQGMSSGKVKIYTLELLSEGGEFISDVNAKLCVVWCTRKSNDTGTISSSGGLRWRLHL